MDDFESIYPATDDTSEIKRKLNNIEEQLTTVTPGGISSQVLSTLKRLTKKTYVGTGATGDAVFNGTDAVTGCTRSGTTYTMTQDNNYNNVTVSTGVVVVGRQYLLFIKGTLTNQGTIYANGGWW